MIEQKATEAIKQAVCYELQKIVKDYGVTYNSNHEGYAVLKEEIEEAQDAFIGLNCNLSKIWNGVKINFITEMDIEHAKQFAIALAEEAVQCAAVCERFLETVKGTYDVTKDKGKITFINTVDPPDVRKQLNPDAEDINSK